MTISVHEAKTHLSKYLVKVEMGEEFLISRGKTPVAKLVPLVDKPNHKRPNVGEMMDIPFHVPASALAPLSDKELQEMGL